MRKTLKKKKMNVDFEPQPVFSEPLQIPPVEGMIPNSRLQVPTLQPQDRRLWWLSPELARAVPSC